MFNLLYQKEKNVSEFCRAIATSVLRKLVYNQVSVLIEK